MSDVTVNVNVKGNLAKRKQYYTGDIPDGAVSMSKLAPDVTVIIEGNENGIDELREEISDIQSNKADKTSLLTKADKEYNSGFVGGKNAKLNAVGGAAAGLNAQASSGGATGSGAQASEGGAAGSGAYTSHGGSVGKDANSMHGGAVGRGAKTLHGAAVGDGAQTVDAEGNPITAIQLGTGTNTEEGTAKFFDYTMMNADGTIPKDRTPDTINRYNVSELPSKSVTYDFADGVSKFINDSAQQRFSFSVVDGVQVLEAGANTGNAYARGYIDFGTVVSEATRIIIDYDTKSNGGRWKIGPVDLSKRPADSWKQEYDSTGVAYQAGNGDSLNQYYINDATTFDTTLNDVWIHTNVNIDMVARTVKYTVSVDDEIKFAGETVLPDSVVVVDGLEVYTYIQGTVYIDNITVNALYDIDENGLYVTPEGEYIYRDGKPVRLGEKGAEYDLSGYYTKAEADGKFLAAEDVEDIELSIQTIETEMDELTGSMTTAETRIGNLEILSRDIGNDMDKAESDIASEVAARKAAILELEQDKADKTALANYYTKTETDEARDQKADKVSNGGFIAGENANNTDSAGYGGVAIGENASAAYGAAIGSGANCYGGAAIGHDAGTHDGAALGSNASAYYGGAVGSDADAEDGGAVGLNAKTENGFAGGKNAKCVDDDGKTAIDAVQLGTGTNNTRKSVQAYGYRLMNADGTIPAERIAAKSITMNKLSDEVKTYIDESTGDLSDYYTKTETDTKIAEAKSIIPKRHIVDTLPTEGIDTNGTYLVPAESPNENNLYDEYAYINGAWEKIGSAVEVDLSGYYTKTETDDLLDEKAAASTVEALDHSIQLIKNDTIPAINLTLNKKADEINIFTAGSAETEMIWDMQTNTEVQCATLTSLALTVTAMGSSLTRFISSVVFTSGTTATSLTYPDTITMIGTDCIDGVFAPVANKRYTVIVAYDGAGLVGYVAGHEVTA